MLDLHITLQIDGKLSPPKSSQVGLHAGNNCAKHHSTPLEYTIPLKSPTARNFAIAPRLLYKTAVLCHCIYTYQQFLFVQMCTHQTPMHFSRVQGKMHATVFCVAVQNKRAAVLCHCIYTYQQFLFCTDVYTPDTNALQQSSGQNACHGVLCCCAKQAGSSLVPMHLYLSRLAFCTDVHSPDTNALQQSTGQNACHGVLCCCTKQAGSSLVPMHLYLSRLAFCTDVHSPDTNALQQSTGQNACHGVLCCCAK